MFNFNIPNTVTIVRVILAFVALGLLWLPGEVWLWMAFLLTILVIWGDGLDGFLARKLNQCSRLGAVLDIAGDRIVEMSYWVVFAVLNWVPLWVPLLFLVRGIAVDTVRSYAAEQGYTAFGKTTMMRSVLGQFLVASNFSRGSYAVIKAAAFCLVIIARTNWAEGSQFQAVADFLVYLSCAFCVVRGLPVLIEGRELLK